MLQGIYMAGLLESTTSLNGSIKDAEVDKKQIAFSMR